MKIQLITKMLTLGVISAAALLATSLTPAQTAMAAPDCSNYSNTQLISWPEAAPVWEMCMRRARFSRPTPNGSGIELFEVSYNGHLVFDRFNIPVLNVEYGPGGCGCFRDWVDQEVRFEAINLGGCDNGFCETDLPAETTCDCAPDNSCDGNPNNACNVDVGDFTGVSSYSEADRFTLTTHTAAGWYRYTLNYTFHMDGTFEPDFGFSSTPNGCTDTEHFHHGYWRMDFDINGPGDDTVYLESSVGSAATDTDNDAVFDNMDNCINVSNPDQRDTDSDGFGNACDADLNNDGMINFADLQVLKQVFFSDDPDGDFNGDGGVDFEDLALMKATLFGAPGPSGQVLNATPVLEEAGGYVGDVESWRVTDAVTGRGYRLVPGSLDHDLKATVFDPIPFAHGDYWVTAARDTEEDDNANSCQAQLNNYLNGESTDAEDVVLWYRIGDLHEGLDECQCGRVGPKLVPVGDWSPVP